VVDFDDMILFPLVKNLRVKFTKDLIILDEAQDLSKARQALARKFLKPGTGRMIVVGDDRQAIYGFSGADAQALENLTNELNAVTLPLTVTWRCPKAVIREAQKIVADIECATDNEGEVTRVEELPADLLATDAILCRNTAPLVTIAYSLIRKGVACKVEGRAIGDGLLRLVDRWKVSSVDQFIRKLEDYRQREIQKAMAKNNEAKVEEINDRVETLLQVCLAVTAKGQHSLTAVRDFINNLFSDDVRGVLTLATYHRSKGREWNRVFLWEHATRCPSRAAKQEWQKLQEQNLAYVAITRSKNILTFVN
jgi:superfamily I DNA/RNA helicase